jgi:hypothetical protein
MHHYFSIVGCVIVAMLMRCLLYHILVTTLISNKSIYVCIKGQDRQQKIYNNWWHNSIYCSSRSVHWNKSPQIAGHQALLTSYCICAWTQQWFIDFTHFYPSCMCWDKPPQCLTPLPDRTRSSSGCTCRDRMPEAMWLHPLFIQVSALIPTSYYPHNSRF